MPNDFHEEDLLEEFVGVPEFLHASKEAVRWLCQALVRVRLKRCGREELAWLFGLPESSLCEALPSSADSALFGESLLDIGFLPRKTGCLIQGCRSSAHLNGRKCTLCKDLRDGATHALVIVEGGTAEQPGTDDLDKTIMVARKNLELAAPPECHGENGFPSLSILLEPIEEEQDCLKPPSEVLGTLWQEPSMLPDHLRGGDALVWLAGVVGRLMDTKNCGFEEIIYLLDLCVGGKLSSLGEVPGSITADHQGSLLEALGFVPLGYWCTVEGCNSYAHLNGRKVQLCKHCPEGQAYVKIGLGEEGELQMHRKNLRLLGAERSPPPSIPEGGTGQGPRDSLPDVEEPPSRHLPGKTEEESVEASSKEEVNSFLSWLFGSEAPSLWCGGSQQARIEQAKGGCPSSPTCCRRGDKKETSVFKEEVTRYQVPFDEGALDGMHPSFGAIAAGPSSAASGQQNAGAGPVDSKGMAPAVATRPANASSSSDRVESVADKLEKVVALRAKGQLTESEFRMVKEQLLSTSSQKVVEEVHKLASMQAQGWLTAEEFNCAKAKLLSASPE